MMHQSIQKIPFSKSQRAEAITSLKGYNKDGMLIHEREIELIKAWQEREDHAALTELIQAYHPLIKGYVNKMHLYGLPHEDLYSEAVVGLIKSLKKFEVERGHRFATYVRWWIKASVGQYILDNWSMVRIGTTNAHRRLFFSVRTLYDQISKESSSLSAQAICETIATKTNIPYRDVHYVVGRMSSPVVSIEAESTKHEARSDHSSFLDDAMGVETDLPSDGVVASMSRGFVLSKLKEALCILDHREHLIILSRVFCEEEAEQTLEEIGRRLGVTRERVRQIQEGALRKMREYLQDEGKGSFDAFDRDLLLTTREA